MRKNVIRLALCAMLFALCLPAEAQQPTKGPRIGYLSSADAARDSARSDAIRLALRELGYVEGQNIAIEYRYGEGKLDRLPELAAELVRLKVDVIVVAGGALAAAKQATNTIPIVVATAGDLVGDGYVASLARPGGNITGSTNIDSDLSAIRLELLKQTFPKLSRVAFLSREGNRGDQDELRATRAAAPALGVRIQSLEVKDPSQFQSAFTAMTKDRAGALIITNNSFNFAHRKQIFPLAAKIRLPTMCGRDAYVEHGCLMSYAASRLDSMRRAAYFVDKILKGIKPADLPVQQPTKFELVIDLKTAKQIGVTILQSVLYRADRVIR